MTQKRLIVEGWRGIAHSYAVFNQFQCLEFLNRPDLRLLHRDVRFYHPGWKRVDGLFRADQEAAIAAIPSPSTADRADATLRVAFPLDYTPSASSARTVVWGTSEFLCVPPADLVGGALPPAGLADNVVAVTCSNWAKAGFVNAGIDPAKVHVVPLGYDPDLYSPPTPETRADLRRHLGIDGFHFLNIGAMTGNKGVSLLLSAFAEVSRRHPEVRLVLKGLNAMYSSEDLLRQQARMLPQDQIERVLPRIRYIGQTLTFADMAKLYHTADAYVTPYHAEGFNLPVLEAAACGLPVICTAGGSTDDFTSQDFAAYVPAQIRGVSGTGTSSQMQALNPDLGVLIEHMNALVEDPDRVARMRAAGPAYVSQRYTWKHAVDGLIPILFPAGSAASQ
jgi:glycosyltransferase involved in cell wall biosynthesis